jgi:hypothetical protein
MSSLRRFLALSGAFALATALAGAGSASTARPDHRTACAAAEGSVLAYLPQAGRSCPSLLLVGADLFKREKVHTGSTGDLTFATHHLYRCRESAQSKDRIQPTKAIALRHLAGTTWCRRNPDSAKRTLTAPGAIISTAGTIFGMRTAHRQTLIKVAEGQLLIVSTATHASLTLKAGFQVSMPAHGRPGKPRPLVQSADDRASIFLLQSDDLPMGPDQVGQHLRSHGEDKLVLIAENASAEDAVRSRVNAQVTTITAAQASANPKVVLATVRKTGAKTVAAAGSFATLQPILKAIHSVLPPEITVIFVPLT